MEDQQLFTIRTIWGHIIFGWYPTAQHWPTGQAQGETKGKSVRYTSIGIRFFSLENSILHRTDSPVNDLWVNLPVVNSWTSLPVIEGTGHKSHRPNPWNRIGPDRTELGVNLQTSPPVMGPDRTGPNWVSISRRVHRSRDSWAIYRSKNVRLAYRSAQTVFCTTWKNSNGAEVIHWTAYYNSVYGT